MSAEEEPATTSSSTAPTKQAAPEPPTMAALAGHTGLEKIRGQMGSVQAMMTHEFATLQDAWAEFLKEREELDALLHALDSVQPSEVDRLKMNVGGVRFEIRQSCVVKNTFFRCMLAGIFAAKDEDGFFYIDRDPTYVQLLFNFLRDGSVDLTVYPEGELERIRSDGEFFMVQEFVKKVDEYRSERRGEDGITLCSFNVGRSYNTNYNGIFFEVHVKKACKLHSISFVAGERRKIAAQAYYKDGGLDSAGQPRKLGEQSIQTEKGQLVCIPFSTIDLQPGLHTLGVQSSVYQIALCPHADSQRSQHSQIALGRSNHTLDQKGVQKRVGEDEFDFCGELALSFRNS